jgi:chromosome segregation ATPase
MNFNIAFFMDVSILALLAATVFLAFRLSLSLRTFKESRFEMEGLVNRLSANIDKAERAIHGMQNTARKSGSELDEVISDAKRLRDELKVMNENGNNLASRLENIAIKNRELVEQIEKTPAVNATPIKYNRELSPVVEDDLEEVLTCGFAIHDKDYDADEDFDDEFENEHESGLQSQAERELFEALQTSKIRQRGRA